MISERAGQPAQASDLIDVAALERDYFQRRPNLSVPEERVRFGTGGHRGKASNGSFNEAHIKAIIQAIVDYRNASPNGAPEALWLGKDTHALSDAAQKTALAGMTVSGVYDLSLKRCCTSLFLAMETTQLNGRAIPIPTWRPSLRPFEPEDNRISIPWRLFG